MIQHHPSDLNILACAAGTLPEPHAMVIAVHAAMCPVCAVALREADEIAGALLDSLPPAPLAADALKRTLTRLDRAPAVKDAAPAPLTLDALAKGRWRRSGLGIAMMPLLRRDVADSRLDLIRVAPGVALLEHGHTGPEMICVLHGGFDDGTGQYHAGDFMEADASLAHRPTALPGEDCICLIATSGHLRTHGLMGWLVRLLIGM
jgi:putative transcriptional regulator